MTKRKKAEDKLPPAGGQPTKYRPEYCEQIVKAMSSGQSLIQFASDINVHKSTVYEWAKDHQEFSDALSLAQQKCEVYWERIVQRKNVTKAPGSDSMLKYYMANRFKWREKTEQDINQKTTVTFSSQIGDDGTITREEE